MYLGVAIKINIHFLLDVRGQFLLNPVVHQVPHWRNLSIHNSIYYEGSLSLWSLV